MSIESFLMSALLLLFVTSLSVSFFKKIGLGSVLGLLIAGIIIGPNTPGPMMTNEVETLMHFTELGVVLFLFMIGLEMRPKKLWAMRREVFGFGSLQIILCGGALALYAMTFASSWKSAVLIGLTLSLSSTAFVLQILQERAEMTMPYGKASFAVLLMQDLAVVPLLALVPLLSQSGTLTKNHSFLEQLMIIFAMLGGVFVLGRYILPFVLDRLVKELNKEGFFLSVMLAVVFSAWAMEYVGLSMALGAFMMGMLLSTSVYSYQIQAYIEPFKGVLMSLFFVSVGMSIDIATIAKDAHIFAIHVGAIVLIKATVIFFLALIFKFTKDVAVKIAFFLSQSGEFGFVIFGAAKSLGVISSYTFVIGIGIISFTMLLTPLLTKIGDFVSQKYVKEEDKDDDNAPSRKEDISHVVVAGYGRVGYMISLMLEKTGIPFIVFDQSIKRVRFGRENNHNIFFGHADDIKFLESLHITGALLVVVTVGEEKISRKIVSVIKTNYPSVKVVVRAKDIDDADAIISMGANWAVPEVAEGSIFFGKGVLREMGVSEDSIKILTEELRAGDYQILRGKN